MVQEQIKIRDAQGGHFQNGWVETEFEPTKSFIASNQLTGAENTIWEKGDQYAVGTKNIWGRQRGSATIFHKSHLD